MADKKIATKVLRPEIQYWAKKKRKNFRPIKAEKREKKVIRL